MIRRSSRLGWWGVLTLAVLGAGCTDNGHGDGFSQAECPNSWVDVISTVDGQFGVVGLAERTLSENTSVRLDGKSLTVTYRFDGSAAEDLSFGVRLVHNDGTRLSIALDPSDVVVTQYGGEAGEYLETQDLGTAFPTAGNRVSQTRADGGVEVSLDVSDWDFDSVGSSLDHAVVVAVGPVPGDYEGPPAADGVGAVETVSECGDPSPRSDVGPTVAWSSLAAATSAPPDPEAPVHEPPLVPEPPSDESVSRCTHQGTDRVEGEQAALCLYQAYKDGDRTRAEVYATPEVVESLFESPWQPADWEFGPDWEWAGCSDAGNGIYWCSWYTPHLSVDMRLGGGPSLGNFVEEVLFLGE